MQFNLKFKLQSVHCITLKHILINYPRNKCRTQPPNANRTCRLKENTKYPNYNNTSFIFSPIPLLSLIVQKYLTMFAMCYNLISSVEQLWDWLILKDQNRGDDDPLTQKIIAGQPIKHGDRGTQIPVTHHSIMRYAIQMQNLIEKSWSYLNSSRNILAASCTTPFPFRSIGV